MKFFRRDELDAAGGFAVNLHTATFLKVLAMQDEPDAGFQNGLLLRESIQFGRRRGGIEQSALNIADDAFHHKRGITDVNLFHRYAFNRNIVQRHIGNLLRKLPLAAPVRLPTLSRKARPTHSELHTVPGSTPDIEVQTIAAELLHRPVNTGRPTAAAFDEIREHLVAEIRIGRSALLVQIIESAPAHGGSDSTHVNTEGNSQFIAVHLRRGRGG